MRAASPMCGVLRVNGRSRSTASAPSRTKEEWKYLDVTLYGRSPCRCNAEAIGDGSASPDGARRGDRNRPRHDQQPGATQLLRPARCGCSSARSSTSSRPTIASRSWCCAAKVASSRPAPTWATPTTGTTPTATATTTATRRSAPSEPAPAAGRRSEVVRLLPRVHGVSEGNRRRSTRLRARRRVGARAHGRHRGRRARRDDRHAGDALPRPGPRLAAHVLPPARAGPRAPPPAHGRHCAGIRRRTPGGVHRGRRRRARRGRGRCGGRRRWRRCRPTAS